MNTLTVSTKNLVDVIAGVLDHYSLLKDMKPWQVEVLCKALQVNIDAVVEVQ